MNHNLNTPRHAGSGFTLIEVMIVVAIVSVLAMVAYPSYRESIAKGRRSDAKAVLLENAQLVERQYTISNRFDRNGDGTALTAVPVPQAPKDGATKYYDIQFTGAHDAVQYTLSAVPTGPMSSDRCGTFTLTHAGVKGLTGNTADVATCWGQ